MKGKRQNSTNSVGTINDGAIVPYGMNMNQNNNRQYNQMNSYDSIFHVSYPNPFYNYNPHNGRYVN